MSVFLLFWLYNLRTCSTFVGKSLKVSNVRDVNSIKGIKFIHHNCCSIINKFNLISHTLFNETTIDFVAFTESWLKPNNDSALFKLNDYEIVRLDCTQPNRRGNYTHGGGILCYIWETLHFEVLPDSISSVDLEALSIYVSRRLIIESCLLLLYIDPPLATYP